MKNKNMIFRLEEELSEKVRAFAKERGWGISTVIREALAEYLRWNHFEPDKAAPVVESKPSQSPQASNE